jgi:alpha-galactosidase
VRELNHIAERVCVAVPEAIFELDVTEAHRTMGLSFLAVGKYSLMNNGPYHQSYDIPVEAGQASHSLFVHPGHARTWIGRTPLSYDKWLPSVLFLTHYLADDPRDSQLVNLASLILGQNGIWGELTKVSAAGVDLISDIFYRYKVLRNDITQAYPIRTGSVGGSPEIYEKISDEGRGAVVIFATAEGNYTYVTEHRVSSTIWQTDDVTVTIDPQGHALITTTFRQRGAKIILFDD